MLGNSRSSTTVSLRLRAVFAAAVTGTAFVFRRRISQATTHLAFTAGLWATSIFLIVLFQNLVSKANARTLVPLLLILVTLLAVANGIRLIQRVLKDY
jgi:hypothetical protein